MRATSTHLQVADAHRGGRIRLAILGQDLTLAEQHRWHQRVEQHRRRRARMIVRADAKAWGRASKSSSLRPLACGYLGRTGSELSVDYDEAMDPETMARAQVETARARVEWQTAGLSVDVEAIADSVSVPRSAPVVAPWLRPHSPPSRARSPPRPSLRPTSPRRRVYEGPLFLKL